VDAYRHLYGEFGWPSHAHKGEMEAARVSPRLESI
jgi:hypothetical protein